jgi:uncharacterized MAPEG superfamily protein
MTIAHWMLLLAAFLPLFVAWIGKQGAPDFDNASPRVWAERQTGWRARAIAAQQNQFEAFPPFAAAVLAAEFAHAPQARIDALAVAFVATRIAYTAAYLSDRATTRSAVWAVGFACVVWLFVLPV